ncbi:hypothetical protein DFP72DRAFT_569962 [Ephemerocybe angulata]|uniref:Uncharacterized protein n=1 Tax=Ephemerocybe angulata TaxID=980116 RepID=A0A8H6MF60_9AGAR|nr:hypothetical protein DFP72DRAFT_569962 [Tulosesus angulatus]
MFSEAKPAALASLAACARGLVKSRNSPMNPPRIWGVVSVSLLPGTLAIVNTHAHIILLRTLVQICGDELYNNVCQSLLMLRGFPLANVLVRYIPWTFRVAQGTVYTSASVGRRFCPPWLRHHGIKSHSVLVINKAARSSVFSLWSRATRWLCQTNFHPAL